MKRILTTLVVALLAGHAVAQTATWSGSSEYVTTITNEQGIKCGYMYNGHVFTRVFRGANCPNSVEVEVQQSTPQGSFVDCSAVSPMLYQQCVRQNERGISGR